MSDGFTLKVGPLFTDMAPQEEINLEDIEQCTLVIKVKGESIQVVDLNEIPELKHKVISLLWQ